MSGQNIGPCILEGRFVRIEPLRKNHASTLFEAGKNLDWAWMLVALSSIEAVKQRIEDGLKAEERNEEYPFIVTLKKEERVIGSTSYLQVSTRHRRAEIGSTWYSPDVWGTAVNPECKYLLLKHAFEDWNAVRIQLGTHANNVHSQRAILKLGAKFEGRLRNHGILPDGSIRDAMLYSIIASEWPEIRSRLLKRIES